MLAYDEFENIARLKRLSLVNAEKDYLQDLILFSIYSNVGRDLVFKGGTCLFKIYKLNRFSEDLDFTLTKSIDIKKLSNKIASDLMFSNIKCKIKDIKEYRNEINIRLLLNGPLYKGNKETQSFIALNISKKEKVLLQPNRESIISLYKDIPNFEIFAMQESEILSEKVRAIFTRIKPRDVYDLWFLTKIKNIGFDYKLIDKKLALYNIKFNTKNFKDRIEEFRKIWLTDLKNLIIGELEDFDKIKKELVNNVLVSSKPTKY
ncbi:MAG: nucleotidyl transferase AbiEii/AbiGii toxin family protein [archaeon]